MGRNDVESIERGRQWANYLDSLAQPAPPFGAAGHNGLHLLAMGDSWFSHFPPFDVLVALENRYGYAVHSVAIAGAHLAEMAPPADWDPARPPAHPPAERGRQLYDLLVLIKKLSPANKKAVKAVLISGGGNDVVADRDVFAKLLNPARPRQPPINDTTFDQIVNTDLRAVLAEVLSATTEISKLYIGRAVPILIHGYAHPVPDDRGGGLGAWLRPVLENMGYADLGAGTAIMADLIDRLNLMQTRLLADNAVAFAHVTHVDLRPALNNTLAGIAYRTDWQNELHPTIPEGFIKVAEKLEKALQILPSPP
jgi:hypothetical protein